MSTSSATHIETTHRPHPHMTRGLVRQHLKAGLPVSLNNPQHRWTQGHVLIAGEAHSGKTNALVKAMISMIMATPYCPDAKRLVVFVTAEEREEYVYTMIVRHLTGMDAVPDSMDCKQFVKLWLAPLGFQLKVFEETFYELDTVRACLKEDFDAHYVFIDFSGGSYEIHSDVTDLRDGFVGPLAFTVHLSYERERPPEERLILNHEYPSQGEAGEKPRMISGADLALYTTMSDEGCTANFLHPVNEDQKPFLIFGDYMLAERQHRMERIGHVDS